MKKFGFAVFFTAVLTVFAGAAVPFRMITPYITGLSSPLLLTNAADGTGRIFIVQQGGIIKVVQPGSRTPTDFLNITSKVLSGGERGLLGLAFHPNFETNHYFFVNYTRQTDGATIVARYTAINNNTIGDPQSERIVLGPIAQPFSNHNGGGIGFREDAPGVYNLYIGMGDGGSGNDPGNRAQNINELLGKFLRITPDVSGSPTAPPYTNPPDNPYVGVNGADEIYAIGMRNPWRWSFDKGGTHQLWAGDVGQGSVEEIDIITLGGNYGWRVYEGTQCTNIDPSLCVPTNYIMPVLQYSSASGSNRCSITGGYVYRGVQNALPVGSYLYGDYCSGEVLLWHNNTQNVLRDTARSIPSFGEDEKGELYVVGLSSGTVDRIVGTEVNADFDGDLKSDISIFRPADGTWWIADSSTRTARAVQFGLGTDVPAPADYDGDLKTDIAVFRPSEGGWYILRSGTNTVGTFQWGTAGDVPAAGDYDGDSRSDLTVFRPSTGIWYTSRSSDGVFSATQFGIDGDVPTTGDYDGDGRYDISIFRASTGTWWRVNSSDGTVSSVQFGLAGDIPSQGDFDGDGKTDIAVFRPSDGGWYIFRSSDNGYQVTQWGLAGDTPVVGDYDGDGMDDIAVFRESTGIWYILRSSNGQLEAAQFGAAGDEPAAQYDRP